MSALVGGGGLALMSTSPSMGQTYYGFSVGGTSSYVRWGTSSWSNQNRHAPAGAFTFRTMLPRWLEVSTGLEWTPKGFNRTTPTVHVTYLTVPVVASVVLGHGLLPVQLVVGGGVAVGAVAFCRRFFRRANGVYKDGCRDPDTADRGLEDIRRWDVTRELRLRMQVRLANGRLFVEKRASKSLVDIQPDKLGRMVNWLTVLALGYEWRY